jgi:endonuclease/exonuclease/phosphatase family metal-dependent hydrolase
MIVVSFNTQHCLDYIEQKIDFEKFAETVGNLNPDVIGLNEMRGEGIASDYTDQVKILAELTGMKYYFFAPALEITGKGPYGNGILSRIPILKAEIISIPDPKVRKYKGYYETRCILKAELEGGVTVLVTHFGLNPDEQENAVATVLANVSEKKCILMGDFNARPDNPVLEPIKGRLFDTADKFDTEKLSFPSDVPDRKIDYIFVTHDVKVIDADIPPVVMSDHRPYVATLEL